MRARRQRTCLVVLALALTDCATAKAPLFGRAVELSAPEALKTPKVKGELLAVGQEQLWVLEPTRVREVPLSEIAQVRVRLHGLSGKQAGMWTLAGALLTGAALTVACAAADSDNSCGGVFAFTALSWGLIGTLSTGSLEKSSRVVVRGPDFSSLRPYARYPQGLPEGLDPASLVRPPTAPPRK